VINVDLPSIEWRQSSLPAPLTGSTQEEQRLYPFFNGQSLTKVVKFSIQYGDRRISHRKVYECMESFKGIQTSVGEETHPVRSSTAAYVKVMEQIDKRIRDNQKISTDMHIK
jgi:hypothetical protein